MSTAMASMSGAVRRMPTVAAKTLNTLLAPSLGLSQDDAVVRDVSGRRGLLSSSIEVTWRSHVCVGRVSDQAQGPCESRALCARAATSWGSISCSRHNRSCGGIATWRPPTSCGKSATSPNGFDAGWELAALRPRKQPVLRSWAGAQHLVEGAAIRANQSELFLLGRQAYGERQAGMRGTASRE